MPQKGFQKGVSLRKNGKAVFYLFSSKGVLTSAVMPKLMPGHIRCALSVYRYSIMRLSFPRGFHTVSGSAEIIGSDFLNIIIIAACYIFHGEFLKIGNT